MERTVRVRVNEQIRRWCGWTGVVAPLLTGWVLWASHAHATNATASEPPFSAVGTTVATYDVGLLPAEADDAFVSAYGIPDTEVETFFSAPRCCGPAAAGRCDEPRTPRLYVGGIIGASFATLAFPPDDAINRSLFTAGGTLGVAFDRTFGALRLEVEGRGRDKVSETSIDPDFSITSEATDVWSSTVNVWRDFSATDNLGVYLGGGIGGGGYRSVISATGAAAGLISANDPVSAFAWQAGCGFTYAVTPRATLDLGYRFFAIDEATSTGYDALAGPFSYQTGFSASELLLTLRVYEPFRGWW